MVAQPLQRAWGSGDADADESLAESIAASLHLAPGPRTAAAAPGRNLEDTILVIEAGSSSEIDAAANGGAAGDDGYELDADAAEISEEIEVGGSDGDYGDDGGYGDEQFYAEDGSGDAQFVGADAGGDEAGPSGGADGGGGGSGSDSARGGAGGAVADAERLAYMTNALALQRAACVALIGKEQFAQLYELLKARADSKDLDEMSLEELARLVFGIIPYDKADAIPLLYKLLYLEAQLETGQL